MPLLLRQRVIWIICEEWPDGEKPLDHATISKRLESAGIEASDGAVRQVLFQLSDNRDITLSSEPGGTAGPTVVGVRPGLCS
jgi:hypothetical protein